jgi:hypothetical protein
MFIVSCGCLRHVSIMLAQSVKLATCIRRVLNSNLGLDTGYSLEGCRGFPQSLKSIGGIFPLFRKRPLPPKSFKIHVLSYHSGPQNLFTNGIVTPQPRICDTGSVFRLQASKCLSTQLSLFSVSNS